MGKKNRQKKKIATDGTADTGFGHNPFAAALGGLTSAPAPAPDAPDTADAGADEPPATPARAVVRFERMGRGGKSVTVISHLDLPPEELARWCKQLRTRLGVGGSVEEDARIIIQGDQRDRVADALTALGITRVTVS